MEKEKSTKVARNKKKTTSKGNKATKITQNKMTDSHNCKSVNSSIKDRSLQAAMASCYPLSLQDQTCADYKENKFLNINDLKFRAR